MDKYEQNPDEIINEILKQKSNNMEFKGTTTKWEVSGEYKTFVYALNSDGNNSFSFWINNDGNVPLEEIQANALLISKAPEMLEMLNNKLSYIEEIAMLIPSEEWTEKFRQKYNLEMHNLEQLIKEATTL